MKQLSVCRVIIYMYIHIVNIKLHRSMKICSNSSLSYCDWVECLLKLGLLTQTSNPLIKNQGTAMRAVPSFLARTGVIIDSSLSGRWD